MLQIIDKNAPIDHYKWGDNCDGWVLVDTESLSVKQEKMPAGAAEQLHYHRKSQQFFFILKGVATIEIEENLIQLNEQQGIHIEAGKKHRIMNRSEDDLEFILSSQPSTNDDRINISENAKN
jgi:mannose-6-phosphate isomerase-like protein (cupin superfamily)